VIPEWPSLVAEVIATPEDQGPAPL